MKKMQKNYEIAEIRDINMLKVLPIKTMQYLLSDQRKFSGPGVAKTLKKTFKKAKLVINFRVNVCSTKTYSS